MRHKQVHRKPRRLREAWKAAVQAGLVVLIALSGYGEGRAQQTPAPAVREVPISPDQHERGLLFLKDVEKDRLITGSIDTNNYGSRLAGRERFGLSLNLNNPLGVGDGLAFRGMTSQQGEDLWLIRTSYTVPLSTRGTKVGTAYTHVESQVEEKLRELEIPGAGDVFSLFAAHPFVRSRPFSLYGQIGYDHKNLKTTILGEQVSRDRLRVLTFGGGLDAVDGWRGITNVALTLHQGIPGFLDGLRLDDERSASRAGASGRFTKLTLEAGRLQQIAGPTSLFLKIGGQFASTPLVFPEQFAIGGQGTVRGYPIAELTGDHGYAVSGEFRWNAPGFANAPAFGGKKWGDVLQLFTFVDQGSVTVIDPIPGQARRRELLGGGGGFRFGIPNVFYLKIEYARPVPKPDPSDHRYDVVYFQFITWF